MAFPHLRETMNMDLWNNERFSTDATYPNLYKIYSTNPLKSNTEWYWYSNEQYNNTPDRLAGETRFYIFVEDSILQNDDIDNDNDSVVDEIGEGVDFYTADLRINTMPQVAHVDSMNYIDPETHNATTINYLWYADNFSEGEYNVTLFISDIYGQRDTLGNFCENNEAALTFYEDETCPFGVELRIYRDGLPVSVRINTNDFSSGIDLMSLVGADSLFVFADFDSIAIDAQDPRIFGSMHSGSGVDVSDATDPDSMNWNNGAASFVELLDMSNSPVGGFTKYYYNTPPIFTTLRADISGSDTHTLPDGDYKFHAYIIDKMGNHCDYYWQFRLDRSCGVENVYTTPVQYSYSDSKSTCFLELCRNQGFGT